MNTIVSGILKYLFEKKKRVGGIMLFTFSFNIRLKLSYLEADGIGRKSFLSIACNLKWMEE